MKARANERFLKSDASDDDAAEETLDVVVNVVVDVDDRLEIEKSR